MFEAKTPIRLIEQRGPEDARRRQLRHLLPIPPQSVLGSLAPRGGQAIGEYDGIYCAGARRGDAFERKPLLFQQAIERPS